MNLRRLMSSSFPLFPPHQEIIIYFFSPKKVCLFDYVDRCCCHYTPLLLTIFMLVTGTIDTFGKPINCMVPAEFSGFYFEKFKVFFLLKDLGQVLFINIAMSLALMLKFLQRQQLFLLLMLLNMLMEVKRQQAISMKRRNVFISTITNGFPFFSLA